MPPSSTSEQPPREPSALQRLESYLRRPLRISVHDGRVFLGTFAGIDKPLNILLANTEEYKPGIEELLEGRYVGQVLIPWRLVARVEGPREEDEDMMYL